MRSQAFRQLAVILVILFIAGTPVQAGPVVIREVIQVLGNHRNPPELRLRNSQDPSGGSVVDNRPLPNITQGNDKKSPSPAGDSLLGGVAVSATEQQGGVDIVAEGDVEGVICDCGEFGVLSEKFPVWPLVFLAGIPVFFIDKGCENCIPPTSSSPTPNPTPTPTPPPIPEPTTLLLLGSGLAAFGIGLRRRQKNDAAAMGQSKEEGQ